MTLWNSRIEVSEVPAYKPPEGHPLHGVDGDVRAGHRLPFEVHRARGVLPGHHPQDWIRVIVAFTPPSQVENTSFFYLDGNHGDSTSLQTTVPPWLLLKAGSFDRKSRNGNKDRSAMHSSSEASCV